MSAAQEAFARDGCVVFDRDARVEHWIAAALPAAERAVRAPKNAHWHQCEGTWFVGVDALPNDPAGCVGSGPTLDGPACDLWRVMGHDMPPLHPAQVSVTYPGYPKPRTGESDAAFRYRRNRDAAHVDGLLPVGPDRRRKLQEPHAFILGMPLNSAPEGASPLVVWPGSHTIMHAAFRQALEGHPDIPDADVTEVYQTARRQVFETLDRRPLHLEPGQSVLLHRMILHGVGPWNAGPFPSGRMIAYFRPEWPGGAQDWLRQP